MRRGPLGSWVRVTLHLDSTRGRLRYRPTRRSGRTWCRTRGRARNLGVAPPFWMEMAIMTGTLCATIKLSRAVKRARRGRRLQPMKEAAAPGTY